MKEVSIEEKAKAYDKALERAKDMLSYKEVRREDMEYLFPQLKESEDDEIKKWLIEMVEEVRKANPTNADHNGMCSEAISWLETQGEKKHKFIIGDIISNNNTIYRVDNIVKNCMGKDCYFLVNVKSEKDGTRYLKFIDSQGRIHNGGEITWLCEQVDAKFEKQRKQKPADKVEPKFKVGDWVTNGKYVWKIIDVKTLGYILQSQNGELVDDTISYVDREFRLWTIQDAKDGDVLQLVDVTAVFKNYIGNKDCICYCSIYKNGGFEIPLSDGDDNVYGCIGAHPATKEQRDILFQKMHEAGYEWDVKKKELKKSVQNSIWNEEDEKIYNRICDLIHNAAFANYDVDEDGKELGEYAKIIDWFKSIKDRIQPKQEWNEDGATRFKEIITFLNNPKNKGLRDKTIEWLKKRL